MTSLDWLVVANCALERAMMFRASPERFWGEYETSTMAWRMYKKGYSRR